MWNVIEDENGRLQITRRHRWLVGKSCKPRRRERLLGKRGRTRRVPGGWRCQDVDHPLWLNETSGSRQPLALPERSDLHSLPPHAWGPSPVPPARPSAGGRSPGCSRTTTSLCNLPCTRAPLPCSETQYSHSFYVLQENSFW